MATTTRGQTLTVAEEQGDKFQNSLFWKISLIISCVKILFIPAYRSTDFEVHRNWLAITHSLPWTEWYHSNVSEWTLDYPPVFAFMEHGLSYAARFVDPEMLNVTNLNYASFSTIVFQRMSVVITDFVFVFAVLDFINYTREKLIHRTHFDSLAHPRLIFVFLFLFNFGLLLVDHIHFQYNGILFGVLVFSIVKMYQGRFIEGAFWFAVVLNMKHIYLYVAPAYGIYLLRSYCYVPGSDRKRVWQRFVTRFLSLGVIVIFVFLAAFSSFIVKGQMMQILSRLFPFKRGLCHAYWAPNFWAMYNILDKVLTISGSKLNTLSKSTVYSALMTGGLVQEFDHVVLISIKPIHTLILTIVSILPALAHLWIYPSGVKGFVRCIVMCAYGSFLFGWHVHEKAILLMIIPLIFLVLEKKEDARIFLMLSSVGHYSLFPLIHTTAETPIKYGLYFIYMIFSFYALGNFHKDEGSSYRLPLLTVYETAYIAGLVPVEFFYQILHRQLGLDKSFPFLPLMLISVYCAFGIFYIWVRAYQNMLIKIKIK